MFKAEARLFSIIEFNRCVIKTGAKTIIAKLGLLLKHEIVKLIKSITNDFFHRQFPLSNLRCKDNLMSCVSVTHCGSNFTS